jgi:MSHA biogenesis protein MshO
VIFNTGQPGANAYSGDNIATITAALDNTAADGSDQLQFDNANFSSGLTAFPNESPRQRFQIVDTPVSYICNLVTGEISRFQDYAINAAQPTNPAAAPLNAANSALLADRVTACSFSYAAGNLSRSGLATLQISISDSGETITLIQQAHPVNLP